MVNKVLLEQIKEKYNSNNVCMGEILATTKIGEYNLEEIFDTILVLKNWADGDKFYQVIGTENELYEPITPQ